MSIQQLAERTPDGQIKPLIAVKTITPLFFKQLGISMLKLTERQKSAKKYRKKQKQAEEQSINTKDENILLKIVKQNTKRSDTKEKNKQLRDEQSQRELIRIMGELRHQRPDLPLEEIKSTALKMTI